MRSPVSQFLRETFPTLPDPSNSERCWVSDVLKKDLNGLPDLHEAIELVSHHSQIETVRARLQKLHPVRKQHKPNHDQRVLDCLTEVCAFGWGALNIGGSPILAADIDSQPDVHIADPETWIEAKVINPSWRMEGGVAYVGTVTPLQEGFWKKITDHYRKACTQLNRKTTGRKVFFLNLMLDIDKISDRHHIFDQLRKSSDLVKSANPSIDIVISYNFEWKHPIVE